MFNIRVGFSEFLLVYSAYALNNHFTVSIVCLCLGIIGIIARTTIEYESSRKISVILDENKSEIH